MCDPPPGEVAPCGLCDPPPHVCQQAVWLGAALGIQALQGAGSSPGAAQHQGLVQAGFPRSLHVALPPCQRFLPQQEH